MASNERLRVAVVAAAVGAAVGAQTSRTGSAALPPAAEHAAADLQRTATDVPADSTPRWWVPQMANAISLMAVGALVTLAVLWGSGAFQPQASIPVASAASGTGTTTGEPLPRTAAELAAAAASASEAAPAEAADDTDAQTDNAPEDAEPEVASVERADPRIIEIPVIDVQASVIPLGLEPTGELEVPEDFAETGWWTGGANPGEQGPSVIVGHVDSFQGPAVFFNLRELVYDDLIRVTRVDGTAATFAVRNMVAVEKDEFPTDLVYGPTDDSQLRLITCDGDFAAGSYLGNLIVTAELIMEHPAPTTGLIL